MRTKILLSFFLLTVLSFADLSAQEINFGGMDASPMDAAHYPRMSAFQNYLAADDPDRTRQIRVYYSRPKKKGRQIFGGLVPYGQLWRLGANEATEVTFYQPVEIGGVYVSAGSYTLFATPYPNEWTIELSRERFVGGTANLDASKVVTAVTVPVTYRATPLESFTIGYRKIDDSHVEMVFAWDNVEAALPVSMNPALLAGDDVSPMDLVAYPPMSRLTNLVEPDQREANQPQIRVVYSRPQMKGRAIFGKLIPYGTLWRLGANETNEVTFFQNVMIGDTEVEAGTYGLFANIKEGSWEFILHESVQSWGQANFDEESIVATYEAKTEKTPETLEALSMTLVDAGDGTVHLAVGWENTMARMPIKVMK
jgi:hypothetical protein